MWKDDDYDPFDEDWDASYWDGDSRRGYEIDDDDPEVIEAGYLNDPYDDEDYTDYSLSREDFDSEEDWEWAEYVGVELPSGSSGRRMDYRRPYHEPIPFSRMDEADLLAGTGDDFASDAGEAELPADADDPLASDTLADTDNLPPSDIDETELFAGTGDPDDFDIAPGQTEPDAWVYEPDPTTAVVPSHASAANDAPQRRHDGTTDLPGKLPATAWETFYRLLLGE